MRYKIYKRTSPSGHSYVGYTSGDLMRRWKARIHEVRGTTLPLAYAIEKYGSENWIHEILFETDSLKEAQEKEIEYIAQYGYYNVAKGGNGGDTGRNGDPEKRKKQSEFMKQHLAKNPMQATNAVRKVWKGLRSNPAKLAERNRKISNSIGRGKDHWNHTGLWVVNHNKYETAAQAAKAEGLNEHTVVQYCNNPDFVIQYSSRLRFGKPGQTRREAGFYRIYDTENNN